jgi:pyridoxamine 5'-phosphate oxidase
MGEDVDGDPLELLARWIGEAGAAGLSGPSTMTLATAGADGVPQARTVLVTAVDADSVRFHSSTATRKTVDLAANPRVSGVFHWPALGRQVVLEGTAELLDAATSRAAFPTRPRPLQLVAWVYEELTPGLRGPDHAVAPGAVEAAFAAAAARDPATLPMPASWTTVRVVPWRMDFWRAGTANTPPARTRFVREGRAGRESREDPGAAGGWRDFPVLP